MSPIHDPDSPGARRLTRLGARMARNEDGEGAPHRRRRGPDRHEVADRPRFDPGSAAAGELDELPVRERRGRGPASGRPARATPNAGAAEANGEARSAPAAAALRGLVVATTRGPCEVELEDGTTVFAHLPKVMARADRSQIAVGDRVRLARRPAGELAVDSVEERRSRLSRPDPFHAHRERILAANLDLAVVVASWRNPPFAAGLVDRFLVALAHGGVAAAIALNKIDLAPEEDRAGHLDAALADYRGLGLPVVSCSTLNGDGLGELRRLIAGRTVALVGHSGVGKSSLLNALAPAAGARVGEVVAGRRGGRHTTTRARIYRLPDSTRIVDTPGVREFGLWEMTPRELAAYFDEFDPLAPGCRFADCSHDHEPDCAVRAAAERGEIAADRYATYLRILESLTRE